MVWPGSAGYAMQRVLLLVCLPRLVEKSRYDRQQVLLCLKAVRLKMAPRPGLEPGTQ